MGFHILELVGHWSLARGLGKGGREGPTGNSVKKRVAVSINKQSSLAGKRI